MIERPTEQDLNAYVDSELSPQDDARVAQAIAQDPNIAARVATLTRLKSMLSTLGPVMERPPTPPSYYTATVPLSTAGGLPGTPLVDYTGPLTWTFPHFVSYTGHLTQTTVFLFDPGEPGYTFNVTDATALVEQAKKDVQVMHCMPISRNTEITDEVLDSPASIIFDEAENRLHTEKALLALLMGGYR